MRFAGQEGVPFFQEGEGARRRESYGVAIELLGQFPLVGEVGLHQAMKIRTVPPDEKMHELMQNHIVDASRRRHDQPRVEGDEILPRGAAAKLAGHLLDLQPGGQPGDVADPLKPLRQKLLGLPGDDLLLALGRKLGQRKLPTLQKQMPGQGVVALLLLLHDPIRLGAHERDHRSLAGMQRGGDGDVSLRADAQIDVFDFFSLPIHMEDPALVQNGHNKSIA